MVFMQKINAYLSACGVRLNVKTYDKLMTYWKKILTFKNFTALIGGMGASILKLTAVVWMN